VRDIQNSQCLMNVEYSGATCPHVTIQFGDTKDDVGLNLVKEGLVMVDVRKEKHLQKIVSEEAALHSVMGGSVAKKLFHVFNGLTKTEAKNQRLFLSLA